MCNSRKSVWEFFLACFFSHLFPLWLSGWVCVYTLPLRAHQVVIAFAKGNQFCNRFTFTFASDFRCSLGAPRCLSDASDIIYGAVFRSQREMRSWAILFRARAGSNYIAPGLMTWLCFQFGCTCQKTHREKEKRKTPRKTAWKKPKNKCKKEKSRLNNRQMENEKPNRN